MAYWLPFVVIGGTLLIFGIIALFSGSRRRRLLALGFRVLGVAIAILSFVGVWIYAAFYTSDTLLPSYVPLVLMVAWPALFVVGSLIREGLLANEQARNQQGLAYKILFALWLGLGLALFIGQAIIAAKTEASYQWLAFSVAIVCAIACTIAVCVSIYRAYQGAKLPRLNARKGLAGVIFADVANFMAIVAGVGGASIFPFHWGWWRLQILSGFLALLVGLSLLYQWMNSALTRAEKGIAWFSTMVGLCTIVSGLAPKLETTAQAPASMAYVSGVTGILTSALVGILGLVLVIGGWRKESWPTGPSVGIGVLLLLSLIGTIWFAVASFNPPSTTDSDAFAPYTLAGNIVGMVAVGSWMLAELLNTWPLTKDYLRAPNANVSLDDFTGWEKSVFEIVGALITLVYLVLVTANSNFQTELSKAFFHYGAALAAVGTIKAMIRGIFRQRAKMGQ